jgi:hypothetical protein
MKTWRSSAFINSQSHFRPSSGNPQVAPNLVAISDVDACLFYGRCGTSGGNSIFRPSPTGFYLLNDLNRAIPVFTSVTPNDVRFIVNGAGAAQKFGTPFGNVGRNTFIGDRIEQFDLSIFKTFRITVRVNLQYRFQAINALDHPNFGIPASINLDNAGSTFFNFQENNGGNRVISMGLRLAF